jgi:RNA polymerase sigma factor FliA
VNLLLDEELPGDAPAPDEPEPDDRPDLHDILTGLSERERVVLTLRLESMSYASIGRALGMSEANASQIHSRAVRRLRQALAGRGAPQR